MIEILRMLKRFSLLLFILLTVSCSSVPPALNGRAYRLATGPHRIPVTLYFDTYGNHYTGTFINDYAGFYTTAETDNDHRVDFGNVNVLRDNYKTTHQKIEDRYLNYLAGEKFFRIEKDRLYLTDRHGETLEFIQTNYIPEE